MTDAELIAFAAEFRAGLLDGKPSDFMCATVCMPLAGLLGCYGIEAEVIEGDLGEMNHCWLLLADGRVLDPTADQFNSYGFEPLPPVYLGPAKAIHPRKSPTPAEKA